ncbi:TetR/AcrR family transcriptional regulator [Reyranella sp. CPCC 100927]|uniref:TetR/AcrR family transcriptional regulator n=1 Tax=Reyranella sp. CPCC 100927 TaxID=2599616 RepID=UPI0011B528AE|nr:TetR/AcrR family transcriptional regulator [Reyranella sp. CPCC 100927]TWT15182.1 TetR/AcrR family transcriptional regulator [Reyranella sp. CPCC 100927]
MKVSKETSAQHRDDLLRAASRLFRDRGFDKVGVAEITAAAGLTHGAFYTHFKSKDELCAEAISQAARHSAKRAAGLGDWSTYVDAYLSPRHVRDRGNGCPYAALGGDVPRESAPVKAAFSTALDRAIDSVARMADGGQGAPSRDRAIAALAIMVGALTLARSTTDTDLRDEILATARAHVIGDSAP